MTTETRPLSPRLAQYAAGFAEMIRKGVISHRRLPNQKTPEERAACIEKQKERQRLCMRAKRAREKAQARCALKAAALERG